MEVHSIKIISFVHICIMTISQLIYVYKKKMIVVFYCWKYISR